MAAATAAAALALAAAGLPRAMVAVTPAWEAAGDAGTGMAGSAVVRSTREEVSGDAGRAAEMNGEWRKVVLVEEYSAAARLLGG